VLTDVAGALRDITGRTDLDPATRLDADLNLDSLGLAELVVRLPGLDAYLAGLELPELIDLTVGDLTRWASA
jgi:hypothetical protein